MLRIITLLNQKNHYLEKFYTANEDAIIAFAKGDFSTLESFYQAREKILETIKYIDKETEGCEANEASQTDAAKREIAVAMAVKEEYVNRILAQDLEILACIETAKSSIIRELQDIRKAKHAVGSYRSRSFNQILDEEV